LALLTELENLLAQPGINSSNGPLPLGCVGDLAKARALSETLSLTIRQVKYPQEYSIFVDQFRLNFANRTAVDAVGHVVSLDRLPDQLMDCRVVFATFFSSSAWTSRVSAHLDSIAAPVFSGNEAITPDRATAIRLCALCLAVECDVHGNVQLGDSLRRIAAGATLLQQRATGRSPIAELIVLAWE
jgi:hypothetical protein